MAAPRARYPLTIEGRQVDLTNPDKVFYPETGFTKAQVVDYYVRVAPALLPHLEDRPLSLKRYPHGVGGAYFYQKQAPEHKPDWLKTTPVWSEERDDDIDYCLANDLPSLVWLANAADLEMHTFMHKWQDLTRPTQVAFDLDPGPGADALTCGKVALMLKERLDAKKLKSFVKVSGSKGVQMHVPVNTPCTYEDTKRVSKGLAFELAKEFPKEVTALMRKELREGKVFIDWSQNDEHKTTVCVYSMRGTPTPSIAAPLTWDELTDAVLSEDIKRLRFTPEKVLARVKKMGDLFEDVETLKQKLPKG
ncbi:MAG: bifunctional non-ous end joining protein LigD [Thermoplasmata archaeon]|jgi:bifunctional non-homologous end joining protein LigD|nr:bifunctional non-ous end joining protein LigD [Thermoplasmata archaeon]